MTTNGSRDSNHNETTVRITVPRPRLCHLHAWPDYAGFGFNVAARKGFIGQYVYQVEPGSPAAAAGLLDGDRIVEVNGTNVARENHQQIVERIRSVDGETVLLVVDPAADRYFKDHKLVINGNMEDIEICESPLTKPLSNTTKSSSTDYISQTKSAPSTTSTIVANVSPEINGTGSSEFRLRLCHVVQWPSYDGYGFTVHTLKDLPGQYVGQIEKNSPAQKAGLKAGDRIIEVNGVNVEGDFHSELRQKIQSVVGQVRVLVVDAQSDKHFHERQLLLHSGQPFVERIACPLPPRANKRGPKSGDPYIAVSADVIESCPYRLRICHLQLPSHQPRSVDGDESGSPPSSGSSANYGFTLRTGSAIDGRPGQFVGDVERGSVAERAGLRRGDRIIEINGFNVETESHREIIERVKAVSGQTKLTVVDPDADKWFQERTIPLMYGLPEKLISRCLARNADDCNRKSGDNGGLDNDHVDSSAAIHATTDSNPPQQATVHQSPTTTATPPDDVPTHPHRLRLCNIAIGIVPQPHRSTRLSPPSSTVDPEEVLGYGFNVHTERYRVGHYVGSVESGSTSDRAGLRPGDRIIEVDGTNVETDSHDELSAKISAARAKRRQRPTEADDNGLLQLLVIDEDADAYFKENGIRLTSDQPFVMQCGLEDEASELFVSRDQSSSGRLRLCQLRQWSDFDGYGFVLIAEKSRPGSFVSRVENGSPAEAGGLRPGDRVVEVNGVNVETESHPAVAGRIRAVEGCLELLVVDEQSDKYFADQKVSPLDRHQPFVDNIVCPHQRLAPLIVKSSAPDSSPDHTHSTTNADITPIPHADRKYKFRLCQLKTSPNFIGYGFDVVTERRRPTMEHYIGKVDAGSPAEAAGLRDGDLIVEVNGLAVVESSRCSHDELAVKIKAEPDRVDILVVDPSAERWYRKRGLSMLDARQRENLSSDVDKKEDQDAVVDVTSQDVAPVPGPSAIAEPTSSVQADDANDHSSPPQYRARLCQLRRRTNYSGYGFNLHVYGTTDSGSDASSTEPVGPDLYVIGAVESGSPAEAAGLRRNDRVIEVNGQKVIIERRDGGSSQSTTSSLDAVAMIRARPDRVNLLVVDQAAHKFFAARGIDVNADQLFVDVIKCPDDAPSGFKNDGAVSTTNNDELTSVSNGISNESGGTSEDDGTRRADEDASYPLFAGSAREARSRMPKKVNAKNMNISLKEKYELFKKL